MGNIKLISVDEWLYKGCFIQKQEPHPQLIGSFEIFKNDKNQTHIGRSFTLIEAKKLCQNSGCLENYLKF